MTEQTNITNATRYLLKSWHRPLKESEGVKAWKARTVPVGKRFARLPAALCTVWCGLLLLLVIWIEVSAGGGGGGGGDNEFTAGGGGGVGGDNEFMCSKIGSTTLRFKIPVPWWGGGCGGGGAESDGLICTAGSAAVDCPICNTNCSKAHEHYE